VKLWATLTDHQHQHLCVRFTGFGNYHDKMPTLPIYPVFCNSEPISKGSGGQFPHKIGALSNSSTVGHTPHTITKASRSRCDRLELGTLTEWGWGDLICYDSQLTGNVRWQIRKWTTESSGFATRLRVLSQQLDHGRHEGTWRALDELCARYYPRKTGDFW
jgi:hypothetical protein